MIDLLNSKELQSVIGLKFLTFIINTVFILIQTKLNKAEFLNLLHLSRAAEISSTELVSWDRKPEHSKIHA